MDKQAIFVGGIFYSVDLKMAGDDEKTVVSYVPYRMFTPPKSPPWALSLEG